MLSRRAAQEQRRQEEEKRGRVEAEILAMPPLAPELMMSGAGDVDNAAAQTQMQAELAGEPLDAEAQRGASRHRPRAPS